MGPDKVPPIEKTLLEHLERTFKVTVRKDFDLRDYDRQVGQQEVIAHLRALYLIQTENT